MTYGFPNATRDVIHSILVGFPTKKKKKNQKKRTRQYLPLRQSQLTPRTRQFISLAIDGLQVQPKIKIIGEGLREADGWGWGGGLRLKG